MHLFIPLVNLALIGFKIHSIRRKDLKIRCQLYFYLNIKPGLIQHFLLRLLAIILSFPLSGVPFPQYSSFASRP